MDEINLFAIIGEYEVRCRLAQAQLAESEARIGKLEAELKSPVPIGPDVEPLPQPPTTATPGSGLPATNPWKSQRVRPEEPVYDEANHSLVRGTVTPEAPLGAMPGWAPQRERA